MHKALAPDSDPHKVRGMYIMGENPAMSDPDLNHARHALASLEHLVVQDIFMTETAWLADVVLPASAWPEKTGTVSNTDRMVQLGRRALDMPGDAQPDLWIIQEIARRLGPRLELPGRGRRRCRRLRGDAPGDAWRPSPASPGSACSAKSSVTYPCLTADDPGQPIVFDRHLPDLRRPRQAGAGRHHSGQRAARCANIPFVLITGRQLEHWHTGSMTRRASVLDAIEPMATASMHGLDIEEIGLAAGDVVTVRSRRGEVALHVRRDDGTPRGAVFVPFAYYEAAANLMTNSALDPFGKIPEFKYCAIQVVPGGTTHASPGYGTGSA